jgi:hypothetical protein
MESSYQSAEDEDVDSEIEIMFTDVPVTRVERLPTPEERLCAWKPPPQFLKIVEDSVKRLVDSGNTPPGGGGVGGGDVVESFRVQQNALKDMGDALYKAEKMFGEHRAREDERLRSTREVLIFEDSMDVFTPDVKAVKGKATRGYDECDCAHGPRSVGYCGEPRFYVETRSDQILEFTIPDYRIEIRGDLEKFEGRFVCETNVAAFSYNRMLSRARLLNVVDKNTIKGRDILAKRTAPLYKDGKKWMLCIGSDNVLGLCQVHEDHNSIETNDVEAASWAKRNESRVINYKLTDCALSFVASIALGLLWREDPARCEEVASDELKVMEECIKLQTRHRSYAGTTVRESNHRFKSSIDLYNRTGDAIFRGDRRVFFEDNAKSAAPLAVAIAPNGRYFPLKDLKLSLLDGGEQIVAASTASTASQTSPTDFRPPQHCIPIASTASAVEDS